MVKKIISGGQTGADQGALDAAIDAGIAHGGWVPKGRKTEAGPLPDKYRLQEMTTASYPKRTEQNILDSEGTLIITRGNLTGGSALTQKLAQMHGFPCLHINLKKVTSAEAAEKVGTWINENKIKVLNVAGSRESKAPGIHAAVFQIIKAVLFEMRLLEDKTYHNRLEVFARWGKENKSAETDLSALKWDRVKKTYRLRVVKDK